ncbi:MAG: glycosyltransferase family 4 protein [Candidatus Hydrogenedentota bacterium]
MRVMLNALQAANRSGTGRHVTGLVCAFASLPGAPVFDVAWPAGQPLPAVAPHIHYHPTTVAHGRRLLADQIRLPAYANAQGVDLLHYPANVGPLRRCGCPVVLTVHDCSFIENPAWFRWERAQYYRYAVGRSARLADRIITVSRFAADSIRDWLGLPEDRVDVVYNGVRPLFSPRDAAAQAAVREKYALPERFFLFVGTLEPRKNLERLVRAYSAVVKRDVGEVLVIAGRLGWKQSFIKGFKNTGARSAHVRVLGHVPDADLPALYAAARAFVWPSLYEGFGLPVAEAMACGAAVLTSSTTALPEIAGDAALLVDPEDESAIAAGLCRLSQDDELVTRLREKGPGQAAPFSWESAARGTAAVYMEVLKNAAGG